MDTMFATVNRPFYRSVQIMNLNVIAMDTYREFAQQLFDKYHKKLDTGTFDYLYNRMYGHTWYVQVILNYLFDLEVQKPTIIEVDKFLNKILEEEDAIYKTYCELISAGQLRLLRAIAIEGNVSEPYESNFLKKHHLTAPSSVRIALKSLIDKSLILKDDKDNYFVYDRFFSLWLEKF